MRYATVLASLLVLGSACGDDTGNGDVADPTGTSAGESTTGPGDTGTTGDDPTTTDDDGGSTGPSSTTDAPGDSTGDDPTTGESTGSGVDQLPPTNGAELLPWLERGEYLGWTAESGIHESTGPHFGDVWTFVNDPLLQSLEAGDPMHPQGAATIKELYGPGDTVRGWAVMVKVQPDSAGGDGWYWYEVYDGDVFADGLGDGLCTGCHSGGDDFFLSPFPLQ